MHGLALTLVVAFAAAPPAASSGDPSSREREEVEATIPMEGEAPDGEAPDGEAPEGEAEVEAAATVEVVPADGTPYWENAAVVARDVAEGGLDVCESVAAPFGLLPGVGTVAAFLAEWTCIVPAALTLDYVAAHHGNDPDGALLEAAVALVAAKLWRDLLRIPIVVGVVGVGLLIVGTVVGLVVASAFFLPASVLWVGVPAALAAAAAAVGGAALGAEALRERGADWIFWTLYEGIGGRDDQPQEVAAARADDDERSVIGPDPGGFSRLWSLAAIAAGTRPPFEPAFAVPVVGPWHQEAARREAIRERLHQASSDVFHEVKTEEDLQPLDTALLVLGNSTAFLNSTVHVGLIVAAMGAILAVASGPVVFTVPLIGVPAALITGSVGMVGGAVALLALVARWGVNALYPFVIPVAYGVFPDDDRGVDQPLETTGTAGAAPARGPAMRYAR